MLFLFYVALWFILQGASCVVLPRSPRLGKRDLVYVLLVQCLFILRALIVALFLFRSASDCGIPWTFLLTFYSTITIIQTGNAIVKFIFFI